MTSRNDERFTVTYWGGIYRLKRRDWVRFLRALARGESASLEDFEAVRLPRTCNATNLTPDEARDLLEAEGVFIGERP